VSILNGGKIRIEDILIGGGLGYAAGQILKSNEKVHDVSLSPGTPMGVLLGNRVLYHRNMGTSTTVRTWQPTSNLKYYMYHGQRWSYNPATGERVIVSGSTTASYHRTTSPRKYYSYQGHPYYLDLRTGERVRLD